MYDDCESCTSRHDGGAPYISLYGGGEQHITLHDGGGEFKSPCIVEMSKTSRNMTALSKA